MNGEKRVVITGCGMVTPLGMDVESLWDGLVNLRCGIKAITTFDPAGLGSALGAEVPPFRVTDYVPKSYRKNGKVMARDIELAVVCAYQAVKDARLRTKCLIDRGEVDGEASVDPRRFGANIGAGLIHADLQELAGALQTSADPQTGAFDIIRWGEEGMSNLTPLWLLKYLPNMLGCHVTIVHDAQAPSNTIPCGEASSHLAVGEAFRTIARGAADVCICGGAEGKINPMSIIRQQLASRLVTGADDRPASACRPFDPSVDGTVAAEGGGLLILEELEFAKARGARIYAEMAGFSAATNATSWSEPEPDGASISLALRNALADASLPPDAVDLVCTFGTGCNDFDASELAGINEVFGDRRIAAIATKGALGVNGAGSGAIDLCVAALALYNNTVVPSPNTPSPDTPSPDTVSVAPACNLEFAHDGPVDARIDVAISPAYSLSGSQVAAVVIKKYRP